MTTMANRQTIVVGVDGSPTSLGAARWAARIADRMRAPMLLAHAVADPNYYLGAGVGAESYPDVIEETWKAATVTLERARDHVRTRHPDLEISTQVRSGLADIVLVELSDQARMTVVGSRSDGTAGSTLLGSTTLRVADHAHGPVVVWRGDPDQPIRVDGPVLVGVDGSRRGEQAVGQAFELASLLEVPLVALHAWTDNAEEAAALLSECLAGFTDNYPDVEVDQIVQDGNPAAALLQWTETAQLVVVASHVRNRVMATLLGSTSQNLLHQVKIPLMIRRSGQ
jgi:nucleotide-binding universal stress UspA family protein